ncbi:hypothetical protein J4558_04325 [Leptolyngbya sp. 15MV]|nr:hypothetical protein J4558_04325 [Leptolyngbya sp. 15MV]
MSSGREAVALARTLENPAITAPLIGVRSLGQLEGNLGALDVVMNDSQRVWLAGASRIELDFLARPMSRAIMSGGVQIAERGA